MAYRPKRPALDPCPVDAVVAVVGGKWKARILHALHVEPSTFGALRRRLPGITQQVLSAQLHALEADGIVDRTAVDVGSVPGSRYSLSEEGHSLIPVLDVVARWGVARLHRHGLQWAAAGELLSSPKSKAPAREHRYNSSSSGESGYQPEGS